MNELRHIATPENTYYNQHFYLLESLSVVKSIVLITDLPNADEITTDLFRNIFDDVRYACFPYVRCTPCSEGISYSSILTPCDLGYSPQQAKNVHICMSELLEHVITETSSLPQEIVDIILAQFLHKHKVRTKEKCRYQRNANRN